MSGILGRFSRRKLTMAERHRLLVEAGKKLADGIAESEVVAWLGSLAASEEVAAIGQEAINSYHERLLREVSLPTSAQSEFNYYFILGVTPKATTEQIQRAYRRKAREVHPDQHNDEFGRDDWARLMTITSDAHHVLTDPRLRRTYDAYWRQRSRRLAATRAKKGEQRGDWETRYRWNVAEIAELEEKLELLLGWLEESVSSGGQSIDTESIERTVEQYEALVLQVRTESYSLPSQLSGFGDELRNEMQRKDKLIQRLRELEQWLPASASRQGATALHERAAQVLATLHLVREKQERFDIRSAGIVERYSTI